MNKITASRRAKMVASMEYIVSQINDESIIDSWLMCGVADGDIPVSSLDPDDVPEYYLEDETFKDLMGLFLRMMKRAWNSGGLYCTICSDDKSSWEAKNNG